MGINYQLIPHQGDIRDYETVLSVLQEVKADVVFHLASFGMSGRDMVRETCNDR